MQTDSINMTYLPNIPMQSLSDVEDLQKIQNLSTRPLTPQKYYIEDKKITKYMRKISKNLYRDTIDITTVYKLLDKLSTYHLCKLDFKNAYIENDILLHVMRILKEHTSFYIDFLNSESVITNFNPTTILKQILNHINNNYIAKCFVNKLFDLIKIIIKILKINIENNFPYPDIFYFINQFKIYFLITELIKNKLQIKCLISRIILYYRSKIALKLVQLSIEYGYDVNDTNSNFVSRLDPLKTAINNSDFLLTKYLIENGANIYNLDIKKSNIIYIACACKDYRILKYLLNIFDMRNQKDIKTQFINAYCDIDKYNSGKNFDNGITSLMTLCQLKIYDNQDSEIQNHYKNNLIQENKFRSDDNKLKLKTTTKNILKIVKLLVKHGADINKYGLQTKSTALIYSYFYNKDNDILRYLLSLKPDLKINDIQGQCILDYIFVQGDYDLFTYMLQIYGSTIIYDLINSKELLYPAMIGSNTELFNILINNNPNIDVNKIDSDGNTLLYLNSCSNKENTQIVKTLIDKNADVNFKHRDTNFTSLINLLGLNRLESFKLLLNTPNIDINAISNNYQNAFNTACMIGNLEMVKLLVEKGVILTDFSFNYDNDYQNDNKSSYLLSNCLKNNLFDIAKFLIELNFDINKLDDNEDSPLFNLIRNNRGMYLIISEKLFSNEELDMIKYLINNGADIYDVEYDVSPEFFNTLKSFKSSIKTKKAKSQS